MLRQRTILTSLCLFLAGTLASPAVIYYVNDSSTNYDIWCTATGSDGNNGTSASTPKATATSVIDTYDLNGGDIVRIDTGDYTLTTNIHLHTFNSDEGIGGSQLIFEASPYGVVIDRNDTAASSYGWEINAPYITIQTATSTVHPDGTQQFMRVTGGYGGFRIRSGADYCEYYRIDVDNNSNVGFSLTEYGAFHHKFEHCIARRNGTYGIRSELNDDITVTNCTFFENGDYNVRLYGGTDTKLLNSSVSANGASTYCITFPPTISDYNLLHTSFGAKVGQHQSQDWPTLADWQGKTGKDMNSITNDPLFVDAAGGDMHPRSAQETGTYVLAIGTWTNYPGEQSPLIDAGDPATPYDQEPWPNGSQVNIGAYGNTEQASKFFINTAVLTVESQHGGAVPPVGDHSYDMGSALTIYVTNSPSQLGPTQYVCTGWSGTGSVPTNGTTTNTSFTFSEASSIAWLWKTQFWLIAGATVGGTVDKPSGWQDSGSNVTINASPGGSYEFLIWRSAVLEQFAAGDGVATNFSTSLGATAIPPGPLTIIAGAEVFTDTGGSGTLSGSLTGSGIINYVSGALTLNCHIPPEFNAPLRAFYYRDGIPGVTPGEETNSTISFAMEGPITAIAWFKTAGAGGDSDGDSIPDSEEGGSTPYVVGADDRQIDSDDDGFMNASEFHAGTGALDSNSFLAAESIAPQSSDQFIVTWWSATDRNYSVSRTTNMQNEFTPVQTGIPAYPPINIYTDTVPGADKVFYRIDLD